MNPLRALFDAIRRTPALEVGPPIGPRPSDLVVYGWTDRDHDGKRDPGEIGHVGVLSDVPGVNWDDLPVEAQAVVVEARRWIGYGIYGLGRGGHNVADGTPFDEQERGDCSGFACHVLGIDRLEDGQWWNTDAIKRDGKVIGGRFDPVPLTVDLRKCRAIHCHGGRPPAVSETSAGLWHGRGVVVRFRALAATAPR